MRVLNRIIYSIIVALGLFVTLSISRENEAKDYLRELALEAASEGNIEYFVATRYYAPTPLTVETLSFKEVEFELYVYNTANLVRHDGGFAVIEGFQIILHQISGDPYYEVFGIRVITSFDDLFVEREATKVFDTPIYSFKLHNELRPTFNQALFFKDGVYQNVTTIEFFDFEGLLTSVNLLIEIDDFQLATYLLDDANSIGDAPLSNTTHYHVSPIIHIPFSYQVILHGAIYVLIAIPITYFLFIFRRNKGKIPMSEGLKRDVDSMHSNRQK